MSIAHQYTVGTLIEKLSTVPPEMTVTIAYASLDDQVPGLDVYFKKGDPNNAYDNDRVYIVPYGKPPSQMKNDSYTTPDYYKHMTTTAEKLIGMLQRYDKDAQIIFDLPSKIASCIMMVGKRTLPCTDHTMIGFSAGTQHTNDKAVIIYPVGLMNELELL